MEMQMINRFEEALAGMSDAEFLAMWAEIKQEGGEGPTAAEFIADFAVSVSKLPMSFHRESIGDEAFASAGEYNYAMAA